MFVRAEMYIWNNPVKQQTSVVSSICVKLFFLFPVFIYSMPGYTCSIKERMLYSSCKNRLLDEVERDYQLEVTKKVQITREYTRSTEHSKHRCHFFRGWISKPIVLSHVHVCLQMEIDSGDGLTEDFLYEEVHPMEHTLKQAFAKPRAPGGKRGNKRLIKGAGENGEES